MASNVKAPHEQSTPVAPQKRESDTRESGGNLVETNEAEENEAEAEVPTREEEAVDDDNALAVC
jgi:hypothetical protein